MDFILQQDQSRGIDSSLKWRLSLQAALQWLIALLLWRLGSAAPIGDPLPLWLAHLLMFALALILTIPSLSMWRLLPTAPTHLTIIGLDWLHSTSLRIILPILSLLLSVPFFLGSFWWGNILIAFQGVLFAVLFFYRSESEPTVELTHLRPHLIAISLILTAIGLIVRLLMVLYGPINSDEAVYMEIGKHIAEGRGIWPAFGFLPPDTLIRPGLGYALVIYGLWAKLFGSGLISIRLLNMGLGLCVLPFVYGTATLWYGRRSGLLSLTFVAVSTVFLFSSTARNNALPMLGFGIAMYLHVLAFKRRTWGAHFVAGLSALLALEAHLLNAFFLVSIGGVYLVRYAAQVRHDRKIIPAYDALAFAAGVALALSLYAFGHLFYQTTPSTFIAGMSPWSSRTSLLNNLLIFTDRIQSYWITAPAESLLIVASMVAAGIRRAPADRHWLTMMLFAALGWFIVGGSGSLHYTTFGVPLYLAGSGALFLQGFSTDGSRLRAAPLAAAFGVALVLTTFVVGYTTLMIRIRRTEDASIRTLIDYFHDKIPSDSGLIAPLRIRPLLMEYEPYIITDSRDLLVAPAMVEQHPDEYWLDVLLDTWPRAYIWIPYTEFDGVTVHAYESYLAARHAEQVVDGAWLISDQPLIKIDASPVSEIGLEPAAYIEPTRVTPSTTLEIETLWVTRIDLTQTYDVELKLFDAENEVVSQSTQPLISGWSGQPSSSWSAFEFHDVLLWVALPHEAGEYLLTVSLINAGCDGCSFTVPITVQ